MYPFLAAGFLLLAVGLYFLFRDTMNRIQYIQVLRIYWITRNTGQVGEPFVEKGWVRHTSPPWWRGEGVKFRVGRFTFNVGRLTDKGTSLLDQLDGRPLTLPPKDIRKWG